MAILTIRDEYFDWLCYLIEKGCPFKKKYKKLLRYLFNRDFYWSIPMDENRFYDGLELREEFLDSFVENVRPVPIEEQELYFPNRNCNLLEMLIALARRGARDIVGDDIYGNEAVWFWRMIGNLNLFIMDDYNFDLEMVDRIIDIFLNRKYEPDGEGNIFYIKGDRRDMRSVDLWCQLCWYINYIISG